MKGLVSEIHSELGRAVTPLFSVESVYRKAYHLGNREALVAKLDRIPFADESTLEWEQVLELRKDRMSRDEIRDFVHWIHADFLEKSTNEISCEINRRFDLFIKAMQKHGIKKKLSYVECAFDLRSKLTSAGLSGCLNEAGIDSLISSLVGISVVIGETSISISKKMIELNENKEQIRDQYAEVVCLARLRK